MLTVLLALAAAVSFSGSDFAAGLATRTADVVKVTVVDELIFAVVLVAVVPLVSSQGPSLPALAWGAGAGICGAGGAMALYLGFRHTVFSVASSVSAVGSAAFSVLAGLLLGERPGATSLAGIALAMPAIAAVSASPSQPGTAWPPSQDRQAASRPGAEDFMRQRGATGPHAAGVLLGLAAGAGFGLFFICLKEAGSAADPWPLAAAAVAGMALVLGVAIATGRLGLPPPGTRWLSASSGVTAAAGTVCYFFATHQGLLTVTAVVTALYPAGTIVLARALLGERLAASRVIGLCLCAASVALIAAAGAG